MLLCRLLKETKQEKKFLFYAPSYSDVNKKFELSAEMDKELGTK